MTMAAQVADCSPRRVQRGPGILPSAFRTRVPDKEK
eukprot:CAMPEP_0197899218 /NCGR_PEP_ID=MMETSP1439-20131203/45951_1 /TAXON_ID=66791 /ORGANISM="Gonyaulax spinifera, Strain CCMP409" /LENGTH=35 /DNA_ID= /DNA_START= /DNA_END= /DNA_ORIENTATION=